LPAWRAGNLARSRLSGGLQHYQLSTAAMAMRRGSHFGVCRYRNAMVFTPDMSKRFRQRKFLHATLSSNSTI